jgi:hypothetical protein
MTFFRAWEPIWVALAIAALLIHLLLPAIEQNPCPRGWPQSTAPDGTITCFNPNFGVRT